MVLGKAHAKIAEDEHGGETKQPKQRHEPPHELSGYHVREQETVAARANSVAEHVSGDGGGQDHREEVDAGQVGASLQPGKLLQEAVDLRREGDESQSQHDKRYAHENEGDPPTPARP